MMFKLLVITFQVTIYWSALAVSQDTKCTSDKDCISHRGFCHKITKLCICENGESSFPSCTRNECTTCNVKCDPLEYYENSDKKCMCRFGGMSTKTCCNQQCGKFETCNDGRCVCKFGQNSSNQCKRCKDDCGQTATCKSLGNDYECVCENEGTFPNCIRNGDFQWSSWSDCGVTCGSGRQTRLWCPICNREPCTGVCSFKNEGTRECNIDRPCIGSWGPWKPWSSCSRTCGKGKRQRRRSCVTTQPCMKGDDMDSQDCRKAKCNRKIKKKVKKFCNGNCQDFMKCNGGKCGYQCKSKILKKCINCRNSCPQPSSKECGWCPWSNYAAVKNEDCRYFEKRSRTPKCPPASEGGRPCEGPAEETGMEVTTYTDVVQQDFILPVNDEEEQLTSGQERETRSTEEEQLTSGQEGETQSTEEKQYFIFNQVCENGCNFIQKVLYACKQSESSGMENDLALARRDCHLKQVCIIPLKRSYFNKPVRCARPTAWVVSYCIGGPNVYAIRNHKGWASTQYLGQPPKS